MAGTTIDELQVLITAQNKQFKQAMREVYSELGDVEKQSSKTGRAFEQFAKVGAVAATAIGTAFVAGSGMAIKAFANYEQLVGGVDTLFKSSSKQIQEYANTAYKTAGLSANNYMETVTSFSASLLQGLGGDTKKAAGYADKAITDMSDNANKMGTNIGMIQYAYQGFAKDNYTMLDNLKLGYGGTAGEMARLVNESGVLNGEFEATAENVKDIPFDQLIEAIHRTQTEMGITGTTAKEASSTITGSWNAVKASFENVLTGIEGSGKALGETFINLVGQLALKVPKIVGDMVTGMHQAMMTAMGAVDWNAVYAKIIPSEEIRDTIRSGIAKVFEFGNLIQDGKMLEAGHKLGSAIGEGIGVAIQALRISMDAVRGWFASINWGQVGIAVGAGALAFVAGLVVGLFSTESLMQFVGFIADNWVAVLLTVATIAFAPAKLLAPFGKLFSNVISHIPFGNMFITAFSKIVTAIRGFFEPIRSAFHGAVVTPITSSTSGMINLIRTLINAVKEIIINPFRIAVQYVADIIGRMPSFAGNAVNGIRSFFSPISGWFRGKFDEVFSVVSGVFSRFTQPASSAINAVRGIWSGIGSWFRGIANNITGSFSGIPGQIRGHFSHAWNAVTGMNWFGLGRNIVDGIANGLNPGRIVQKMRDIASSAMSTVKSFLGIKSPSRRMRDEVGKMMGEGMAIGIDQSTKDAVKSASNSAKKVMGAYGGSINTNLPTAAQLSSKLDVSYNTRLPEIKGSQRPIVLQLEDGTVLGNYVIDAINNKAFMTNSSVLDY